MITRKTAFSSLTILVTAVLSYILSDNALKLSTYFMKHFKDWPGTWMATFLIEGIVSVGLGIAVWMILVWDPGDKIPPILMILLGLVGIAIHALNVFQDLSWHTAFWVSLFSYQFVVALHALLIAFGVAGLFTKRRTTQPGLPAH
jgi:hypothetical protein